ncbi:MAG: hypothetical protein ACI9MR_003060 [Myxococcota bacterium]|jgi:hypothetical protein
MRRLLLGLATLSLVATGGMSTAVAGDFPQIKINHIDASEAPKIRLYFSLLGRKLNPIMEDDVDQISLFKKPESGSSKEVFSYAKGEFKWPKDTSEEKLAEYADAPPEILPAVDTDKGPAMVVVVPGFQDEEYREGVLGSRSRNGAGLFFKKIPNGKMNAIWYNDFVYTLVRAQGRTSQLTRLDTQLEACRKWRSKSLMSYGVTSEEEPPEGFQQGEAHCGLTAEYADIGGLLKNQSYQGFWPQLFGLAPAKICGKIANNISRTGLTLAEGANPYQDGRINAMDAAMQMLVQDADPGQPRILVLTGDGRDGYIERHDACRAVERTRCADLPEYQRDVIKNGKKRRAAVEACAEKALNTIYASEQTAFARRLEAWLGLAKAANIRIYSVVHPTAQQFQADRLAVLAWRSGGTARFAEDENQVGSHYDSLIAEINHQYVVTFVDDDATPGTTHTYEVEAKVKKRDYKAPGFEIAIGQVAEKPFLTEVTSAGQDKLGKAGFIAVIAVVALLLLVIILKIGKKLFGGGGKAVKAAKKKGGKGVKVDKKKIKVKEKAKKAALKKKKALIKAKKKKG